MRYPCTLAALLIVMIGTAAGAHPNDPVPSESGVLTARISGITPAEPTHDSTRAFVAPRVDRRRTTMSLDLEHELRAPMRLDVRIDVTMRLTNGKGASRREDLGGSAEPARWFEWTGGREDLTTLDRTAAVAGRSVLDDRRTGSGLHWRLADAWQLNTGFGYGRSRDDGKPLPAAPTGELYRFSVGIEHDFGGGRVLGASYTLLYAPVGEVASPPDGASASGQLDPSLVHVFGVTFGLAF